MRASPYFFEVRDIMTQFVSAFNDIVIKRYNRDRDVKSHLKVRYVYAPKQRVVHDLTNKAKHITLPAVAVSIAGISRDTERVFNKIEGSYYSLEERNPNISKQNDAFETFRMLQPVPINVTVNMSIMARYQADIEQIISNFVPYNDPYIILSWKLPEELSPQDQEIRSEVLWGGDLNMDYPDNFSPSDPYRLSCDTTFTIKTWLFKQVRDPVSNIFKITTTMTPTKDFSFIAPYYDETERSYIESVGPPLTAAPFITHVEQWGESRYILGYNFSNTTSIHVSSNDINSLSGVVIDPFPGRDISTLYPAYTGVSVDYKIINDNKIEVDISSLTENTSADIIIRNAGGYDTIKNSTLHGKGVMLS